MHGFYLALFLILNVDENIIQIYDDEDIELLYQELVNVTLKACWGIR